MPTRFFSRDFTRLATPMAALFLLVCGLAVQAAAQTNVSPPAATSSFLEEFQAVESRVSGRIVELAKAIPAEHFTWRPADGVRSVSEVFMHLAAVNFFTADSVGVPLPADLPQDLSKVTEKERVVALLEASYRLTQGVADSMAGADFSQPAPGGGNMSLRAAMLNFVEHQGEHLGQLIAYARSVGVTPPWSR